MSGDWEGGRGMGYRRLAAPVLERIFGGGTVSGLSEWELLERYLEARDEVAFEALVARHGPMVMGVCRRMLNDQTDVDDAFQATFLVLVRRARQLGPGDYIGPWLYGVAARVAMRARSEAARRRRFEPIASEIPDPDQADGPAERELAHVIDQELGRLPSKYRSPIVLCYLEGQTHEEAARQLKWPVGTVKGRLARARDLLRSRLARRGLAPSAGALTLVLTHDSSAALNRELLDRTVKASIRLAFGHTTAHVVSASISNLVEGVLTSMFMSTIKSAVAAVVIAGFVVGGAGVLARQSGQEPQKPPSAAAGTVQNEPAIGDASAPKSAPPADFAKSANHPPETVADLERQLARAAHAEWEAAYKLYAEGEAPVERAYQASRRVLDIQKETASAPSEAIAAQQTHLNRIRELARIQTNDPRSSESQVASVKVYAAEAALWLAQAQAGAQPEKKPVGGIPPEGGGAMASDEGTAVDPRSKAVIAKLEEPVSMAFDSETTLEDVLKYIKQVTTTKTYPGIPIYVDPMGLQEAEKSMTSTISYMTLEGIPLRRTLQLMLKQLGLVYTVDDGILYITAEDSESASLGPSMRTPSPMKLKIAKAERYELTTEEMKEVIEFLRTRRELLAMQDSESGALGAPSPAPPSDETRRVQDQMNAILKEMRELAEMLKADKPTRKSGETKAARNLQ
jgi:RNA polymerase sigma factor (sigma-70 family)